MKQYQFANWLVGGLNELKKNVKILEVQMSSLSNSSIQLEFCIT
jgi:hypothetical protein